MRIETLVRNIIETHLTNNPDIKVDELKKEILEKVSKVLSDKTSKEPVIVPVIITV